MIRTNNDIASPRKEIGGRLAQFRNLRGLLQSEFAMELGLSPRSYQNYELGIRDLPIATVAAMVGLYKLNSHWLITGEGGPYYKDPIKVAREAMDDVVEAAESANLNPDLKKLPDVIEMIAKNLQRDRIGTPDEIIQLVRLASASK
ncbi:MAG: helix-turn-helix transcriptional regulator [Sulfitobacter sp.]